MLTTDNILENVPASSVAGSGSTVLERRYVSDERLLMCKTRRIAPDEGIGCEPRIITPL
jgi:hypothetical protein